MMMMMTDQQQSEDHDNDNNDSRPDISVIPRISYNELNIGRVVGHGGFSTVSALNSIDLNYDDDDDDDNDNDNYVGYENNEKDITSTTVTATAAITNKKRAKEARNEFANSIRGSHYVVKMIRTDLPDDEYEKGIIDLQTEVSFLSTLHHPNIISLRGISNNMIVPNRTGGRYFLIVDRLKQTLDDKFNEWRGTIEKYNGYCWIPLYGYCCCTSSIQLFTNWKERIFSSYCIATAIQYLHTNHIIYRDLKPDNIGYDQYGIIKLFDFGLAKNLNTIERYCSRNNNNNNRSNNHDDHDDDSCEELYHLTGNTGSLRYMAPEVALDRPYGFSVDSYSFGIMFWQICSLQTPYAKYSQRMHAERVVRNGERPKIEKTWPNSFKYLLETCWSSNNNIRPSFHSICNQLHEILEDMEHYNNCIPSTITEMKAKKRRMKLAKNGARLDSIRNNKQQHQQHQQHQQQQQPVYTSITTNNHISTTACIGTDTSSAYCTTTKKIIPTTIATKTMHLPIPEEEMEETVMKRYDSDVV